METKLIEACQNVKDGRASNWGKFCVARFDAEWGHESQIAPRTGLSLLRLCGWAPEGFYWVLDLQTGEGAYFRPGGSAHADLEKHRVWVCPMFEPFLEWLYEQDLSDLSALPDVVEIPDAPFAFSGYRRPGEGLAE